MTGPRGPSAARDAVPPLVAIVATLQDHKHTRESWGVATVLVAELVSGEAPFGVAPGVELSVVGDRIGLAAPGERLELRGSWDSTKYGLQLRVTEQLSQGLRMPQDAARWLERLDGVGPKLARALGQHFGDRLVAILSGDEEADLTAVHGIGEDTERHIRDSFAALAISSDLESITYLDSIKASRYEATKIMQWCAKQLRRPIKVLQKAPYDLMRIKGLGFSRVDRLARGAGCSATAPARLEAATLHQLGEIVQRGSTMAALSGGRGGGLIGEVGALLGLDKSLARGAVSRLAANGDVVVAQDGDGRTWVHPTALLKAERSIYRAAKGRGLAAPLSQPKSAESAGDSNGREDDSLQVQGKRGDPRGVFGQAQRERGLQQGGGDREQGVLGRDADRLAGAELRKQGQPGDPQARTGVLPRPDADSGRDARGVASQSGSAPGEGTLSDPPPAAAPAADSMGSPGYFNTAAQLERLEREFGKTGHFDERRW